MKSHDGNHESDGRLRLDELESIYGGVFADGVFICTVVSPPVVGPEDGQEPGGATGFMYTLDKLTA